MFEIGEVVIYGAQGICKIDSIETKKIGKLSTDYYVLKPVFNANTTVFVPVDNEILVAKMQCVLSKSQAEEFIVSMNDTPIIALENESLRRDMYKSILSDGDRAKVLSLIKTIRLERDVKRECGKKLNMNEEQVLHKAELLIGNELAYVLCITPVEAQNLIEF